MPKISPPGHILEIISRLESRGFETWCAGGCVRDALLPREPSDWDIATAALPQETAACFPGLRVLETGAAHGTVTLITPKGPVEVTTLRVDGEYTGHRRPIGVSAQMALGFGIFALVTVVLLWVFQIFLLNPFYQAIKTQEAEQTAEAIVRQLDSDQLDAAARALCIKSGSNIFVSDSRGRQPVGYKHIFQDSLTAGLSQMERAALFVGGTAAAGAAAPPARKGK